MKERISGKICALTGHRDLTGFDYNALHDEIEEMIKAGYDYFLCGMAVGFDLAALKELVQFKEKYHLFLEACVPYPGQEKRYLEEDKKQYRELLESCDKISFICEHFVKGAYLMRDRYMVDHSDVVLAYCKKTKGGTYYTVKYAEKTGIPVIFIENGVDLS